MTLRYGSVCSGIEAASVAWAPLDWSPVFFSEIEKFPCEVLAHHYPDVPNLGDITKFKEWPDADIDVLVGGTPCQSFSVAGLRKGLADPRGNLALTYLAIAYRYRPEWLVWENVPGVLSSDGGRDFGAFLGGLGELGYGFAYRVLDAQYVRVDGMERAVPQRRRRVFVVGHSGDWRRAAAVLFERESLLGHSAPRRETGQVAPTIPSRSLGGGGLGTDFDCDGGLVTSTEGVSHCLNAGGMGRQDYETETFVAHSLRGEGFDASEDGTGRGTPLVPVPFDTTQITSAANRSVPKVGDPCHPLAAGAHPPAIAFNQGELRHADAYEADASATLSVLRQSVGAEAFREWVLGILVALQSPEVLRAWLHGKSLRAETEEGRPKLDDGALPREEDIAGRLLRQVWLDGPDGRASQGRGLAKQLAGQPGALLSVLPSEGAPYKGDLHRLRSAREGAWLLREALSAVQTARRSSGGESEPAYSGWAVRRLTPTECSRLQGFPDDYLTQVTWRGICPPSDGPMYKALGNSMAVNCMRWLGQRIEHVNAIAASIKSEAA